ncbi:MAG TPA: hypothetical protein VHG27_07285 [Xanthobacteraceae bacterium]|nr:hypothetical protein [Xanthobacteraceae bacterium]
MDPHEDKAQGDQMTAAPAAASTSAAGQAEPSTEAEPAKLADAPQLEAAHEIAAAAPSPPSEDAAPAIEPVMKTIAAAESLRVAATPEPVGTPAPQREIPTPRPAAARQPVAPHPISAASKAPKIAPPAAHRAGAERGSSRPWRFGLLAASIALAACIGAAAGAAGFAGVNGLVHSPTPTASRAAAMQTAEEIKALKGSIAQLRGSVRALSESVGSLRSGMDNAGKATQAQFAKLNEIIDRLEKSQSEPNSRLGKVTEALDRLERRMASVGAASPETTATVKSPPFPPVPSDMRDSKPVIEGWTLRDVHEGIALIHGRHGAVEVIVGDDIRGAGRVQDIRRQDGRWVVVTSRGIILSRR